MDLAAVSDPEFSIDQEQRNLVEEFSFFDDWTERYEYLIDLGRKLPQFPSEYKIDDFKLKGCQSQVWLTGQSIEGRLVFRAISDAAIVSGLIALLLRVFSNRTAKEILDVDLKFLDEIGLDTHLSPTRKNGLNSMIQAILNRAHGELKKEEDRV
tara:strand:- start:96 stop:557 length:462 start_codon:yes stop_codon:yes gene_type:complete